MATFGISKPAYPVSSSHDAQPPVSSHSEPSSTLKPPTHSPAHTIDSGKAAASSYSDSELINRKDGLVQSSAVTKEMTMGQEGDSTTVQALAVLSSVSVCVAWWAVCGLLLVHWYFVFPHEDNIVNGVFFLCRCSLTLWIVGLKVQRRTRLLLFLRQCWETSGYTFNHTGNYLVRPYSI